MTEDSTLARQERAREVEALIGELRKAFPGHAPDTREYRFAIIEYQAQRKRAADFLAAFASTEQATDAVRPDVPDGWLLVPREPTREMWAAGGNAVLGHRQRHHDKVVDDVWSAMLSTSPPSPLVDEVDNG